MKNLHFIVNPKAGRGRTKRVWESIVARLMARDPYNSHFGVTYAEYGNSELVTDLSTDTILVAVGGDGTVHYAARIALLKNLTFAVIPTGTGNDYARTLGMSDDLGEAIESLFTGHTRTLDVLQFNEQIVLNIGGFGLDAAVVHVIESKPWLKKLGSLGYALSLPIALTRFHAYSVTIRNDHGTSETYENVVLLAVTNGPRFGGGMNIVPNAVLDDGIFEVCVVSGISKFSVLRLFPLIYSGSHVRHPAVSIQKVRVVDIAFNQHSPLAEYDGEPITVPNKITATLYAQKLKVLLPSSSTR
jgi:diacylglycerol kinase (ATP)